MQGIGCSSSDGRALTRNWRGAHSCSSRPWIITKSPAVMPRAAAAADPAAATAAEPAATAAAAGPPAPVAAASITAVMPAARMKACPAFSPAAAMSSRTTDRCSRPGGEGVGHARWCSSRALPQWPPEAPQHADPRPPHDVMLDCTACLVGGEGGIVLPHFQQPIAKQLHSLKGEQRIHRLACTGGKGSYQMF